MSLTENTPYVNLPDDLTRQLLAHQHRGGRWSFVWTPNTGEFYTDQNGQERERRLSQWAPVEHGVYIPGGWQTGKNLYFGVHPTDAPGKRTQRSKNDTVSAVNCTFAEYDGKDFVTDAEWLPHYVDPDLTGLNAARARGALQKAQTAAIDATYKLAPDEYKRRALAHLQGVEPRPSAAWDSGGGYQAIWLLNETQRITDDNRKRIAHVQREWVHFVGGDPSASDLCRVLRLPGSRNYKPKYAPNYPLVSFLWCDLDLQYTFDELAALLPPLTTPTKREQRRVHIPAGTPIDLANFGTVPDLPHHAAIDEYNRTTDLRDLLLSIGYTDAGAGRMNRPGGDTAGVDLHNDNSASIYSSADPLFCGHRVRPAHVLCVYEYAGDAAAMLAVLARPVNEIIEAARRFVRRADFAEIVPLELQAANGYRTPDTDKAMALGCLAIFAQRGSLEWPIGLAQLSEATGRSLQTCANAMKRIAALFPCVNEKTRKPDEARIYRLCDELRRLETIHLGTDNREAFPIYATLPMDTHRAHDAFVRSMTPLDSDELARRVEWRRKEGQRAAATGDERRRVAATLPSAGPAALVVVDALAEFGPLRGVELCALTCKSKYAVSRAVRRLIGLELAYVDDAGAMALVDGWADRLNELTPQMPTAGNGRRRTIDRLDRTIDQCEEIIKEAGSDAPKWVHVRRERARKRKAEIAQAEGFDSLATVKAVGTGNHSLTWWDVAKIKRREEIHAAAQMDEAEKRRGPEWELAKLARQMRTEGQSKRDFVRQAEYAGYTVDEAWEAAHRAWTAYKETGAVRSP